MAFLWQCSLKCTTASLFSTNFKTWRRDFNIVHLGDAQFLFCFVLFYKWRSGCAWDCLIKLTNVDLVCFNVHLVKLKNRRLRKLDNWQRFLMLIGKKTINIHVFRVASLADLHHTVVDLKRVAYRCVCYHFQGENVTFNLVFDKKYGHVLRIKFRYIRRN